MLAASQDTTRLINRMDFYTLISCGSYSRPHPTTLATSPMPPR